MARAMGLDLPIAETQMRTPNGNFTIKATEAIIHHTDVVACMVTILFFTNGKARLADHPIHQEYGMGSTISTLHFISFRW
jgi:hypothetical protein